MAGVATIIAIADTPSRMDFGRTRPAVACPTSLSIAFVLDPRATHPFESSARLPDYVWMG
jgi:hypothetical protein